MATTIRHIAEQAGVSVGTVSNVLNNPDTVSEETRARVLEVMRAHHYRPSSIARSLKTRRTRTFGLIVSSIFNPFTAGLVQGASEAAQKLGLRLLIASAAHDGHDVPVHVADLVDQWVDGIFLASQPLPQDMLGTLSFGHVPVVLMDQGQEPPANTVGLVGFDWQSAAYQATRHLLGLGHRRIGYVGGIPDRSSTALREEGYRLALAEAGVPYEPDMHVAGDYLTESGYRCARQLMAMDERPTGLVLANDLMALGAYQAAAELGLRIPEDVSVVGMDDNFFVAYIHPALTTVHVPTGELSRIGLQFLADTPDPSTPMRRIVLPTALVVRRSTAAPRKEVLSP
jgi:DNA-binding LacI/PurR family transcriptional regulator